MAWEKHVCLLCVCPCGCNYLWVCDFEKQGGQEKVKEREKDRSGVDGGLSVLRSGMVCCAWER